MPNKTTPLQGRLVGEGNDDFSAFGIEIRLGDAEPGLVDEFKIMRENDIILHLVSSGRKKFVRVGSILFMLIILVGSPLQFISSFAQVFGLAMYFDSDSIFIYYDGELMP